MSTGHIPAWKRLGLKLKHANESPVPIEAANVFENGTKKRKQASDLNGPNGTADERHSHKKSRADETTDVPSILSVDNGSRSARTNDRPRRKKSVSFSTDTKLEDGDTAQTIQHWVPDVPIPMPTEDYEDVVSHQIAPPPKKPKREKRPKSMRDPSAKALPRKARAALDYLVQFQQQRSLWKFNKNHETWLLKHALSTENIPTDQNLALATYIQSLKSQGARQRLVEQSREKAADQTLPAVDVDELQRNLCEAIEDGVSKSSSGNVGYSWLEDLGREHLILLALGESLQQPARRMQKGSEATSRVKKNKSRTSRIEVDSTSSSDSESESESEDGEPKKTSSRSIKPVADRSGRSSEDDTDVTSSDSSSGFSSEENSDIDDSSGNSSDDE